MDFSGQWNSFDILNKIYWWFRFRLLQEGKKSFFFIQVKQLKILSCGRFPHIFTLVFLFHHQLSFKHTHTYSRNLSERLIIQVCVHVCGRGHLVHPEFFIGTTGAPQLALSYFGHLLILYTTMTTRFCCILNKSNSGKT